MNFPFRRSHPSNSLCHLWKRQINGLKFALFQPVFTYFLFQNHKILSSRRLIYPLYHISSSLLRSQRALNGQKRCRLSLMGPWRQGHISQMIAVNAPIELDTKVEKIKSRFLCLDKGEHYSLLY